MESSAQNSSEKIYETLKSEIISLVLKPGQQIGENELSKRFGVSRTPIRLAIRRLADQKLVEVQPYNGTYVTLLNIDEIRQLIYMRIAVEQKVICDFMDIATPIVLEKLNYIIRKQIVLVESQDFSDVQFYELDSQLHEVWFKETGKLNIWKLIQQFQVQYTRFRMLDIATIQSYQHIIDEHSKLFEYIRQKDCNAIENILNDHLNGAIVRITEKIGTDFENYFSK